MIDVTAALIERDGLVLAARRKPGKHLAGYWEFPGGKVEDGESKEACLAREIEEELGIRISVDDYVGQSTHDYGEKVVRLHGFCAEYLDGEIALHDHDEILWLSASELDSIEWAPADVPLINQYRTYRYYREFASQYASDTYSLPIQESAHKFLDLLKTGDKLLDLGCGSGRDSEFFSKHGLQVVAADVSDRVISTFRSKLDLEARVCSYFHLPWISEFDAVWANASLLHCPRSELPSVISNIERSLVPGGICYMSFKRGEGEGLDSLGRFVSTLMEGELEQVLRSRAGIFIEDIWCNTAPLRGQTQEWVNAIVKKRIS